MSEEEKKVIEMLKYEYKKMVDNDYVLFPLYEGQTNILINLIDKLQKELKDSINARFELQRRIDKLQKENEELKEDNSKLILGKFREVADKNSYIKDMYISKDKIKEALGDKNIPDGMILTYIETLVSENNRLEDIEDRKVQIEYNNAFNKGVKSVEDKIRTEIKELEEILEKRKTIDIVEEINRLEELLGDE